ncbi:hypothetical protein O3G_MSEX012694 [Manduca sexta]|uniref:Mab-21-like HhH/H2TH-like domain-containing protein n=1 Tax=Manduca sexta TaxID=7130 RepID=A0A922CXI4_MANSE|nr:hypothetical protein O3G_MSEX012694 [Manduca sexta]
MRDALGMSKIASYYIKTIFFWEIMKRNDKKFWATDPATLFKLMVQKVHSAIVDKNIPYFWNKSNNLIGHVDDNVLNNYETKLAPLLKILEQPANYRLVAKYLLSPQEYKEYNTRYLHL